MTTTTDFQFTKMTGTGNDFLVFDAREKSFELDRPSFVRSVCRRSFGVGADGVVFIEETEQSDVDFKWDFYNSDGSSAEMCGNASRCVARYAFDRKISHSKDVKFLTQIGVVTALVVSSARVDVTLPFPKVLEENKLVLVGEHINLPVSVIDSGVPHVVRENDDWEDEYIHDMGRFLRNNAGFKKYGGANATFYEVQSEGVIHSATYERGVEGVTLACGTGAVAAAYDYFLKGKLTSVTVHVPGGVLQVQIDVEGKAIILSGEARYICEGTLRAEALL
jgi:diaminopimelate epimerase